MEASEYSSSYSTTLSLGGYEELTLRQFAQLSLRRLGEIPNQLPPYKLTDIDEIPVLKDRDRNAALVRQGMSQKQVFELLGVPDVLYVEWTYDFDTKKPFSLTIDWDWNTKKVKKVIRQTPPVWKTGLKRDEILNF